MIDIKWLKSAIDCRNVIRHDLGEPAQKTGKTWHWLCPFHADHNTPSLAVYADSWHCFGCPEHGDVIDWLMKRDGLSFADACQQLSAGNLSNIKGGHMSSMSLPEPPASDWQDIAMDAGLACVETLWAPEGAVILTWLQARGLWDDTIRRAALGFHTTDGQLCGVYVPKGITIPWWISASSTLWALKIRRMEGDPKYIQVKGGSPGLYGADTLTGHDIVVICEGEFDTLLLQQYVGDLIGVCTFGGATSHDVIGWLPWLIGCKQVLVATDNDSAGEDAWKFWKRTTKRARRLLPPGGCKDVTDAHMTGHNLRAWIMAALGDAT